MQVNFLALTKKELVRLLASFLLGLIVGGSLINFWIGSQLDQLIYEKKQLIATINTQETELKQLKESLQEEKRTVVQELKINIQTELDKHTKQELKEKLFGILNSLLGRNISQIDGQLIAETINDRVIISEEKSYQIQVTWLVIQPQSIVTVQAKEKDN
ncbi:hypothetical protein [Halanaerobaculum tunisiense]